MNARAILPRGIVTLAVLTALALGEQIPLPGLDMHAKAAQFVATARLSLFALGVMPLFSILIVVELARLVIPSRFENQPPERDGRPNLGPRVCACAFAIAAFQAFGLAQALERVRGLVEDTGLGFELLVVVTLTGATAVLAALARINTRFGLADGFWLLLLATMFIRAWDEFQEFVGLGRSVGGAPLIAGAAYIVFSWGSIYFAGRSDFAKKAAINLGFVWPPLLAGVVAGVVSATAIFFQNMRNLPTDLNDLGYLRVLVLALTILLATKLRLNSRLRAVATRSAWNMALVEVAICLAGELLARVYDAPLFANGPMLIVAAAVGLDASTQARLAFSPPSRTA